MRLAISTSPSRVKQRHSAHLAQIHAHRVVGFFQRARRQIELDVLAFFQLKIFVGAELRRVQQVDALGADRGNQVVEVVGEVLMSSGNMSFTSP